MKKALLDCWRESQGRWPGLCGGLLAVWLAAGCSTVSSSLPPAIQDFGPSYRPVNVYRRSIALPLEVRRVALLPLTTSGTGQYLDDGVTALEPLIYPELEKTRRFEVIPVSTEQMKAWTGQLGWRTDEPLPADFFAKIKEATSCDAVMFCQLTRYQPYQPLATGWKFSLVQSPQDVSVRPTVNARILWSVDEVLDCGEPSVSTGARNFYTEHLRNDAASADAATILSSPVRFGQYTLAILFGTLPVRSATGGLHE